MTETIYPEITGDMQSQSAGSVTSITEEIRLFIRTWLWFMPKSMFIDYHGQTMSVTMAGVLSEAETNASKYKGISELIVKNHTSAYRATRYILEFKIAELSGKKVSGSALMLDPESNCATMFFQFGQ